MVSDNSTASNIIYHYYFCIIPKTTAANPSSLDGTVVFPDSCVHRYAMTPCVATAWAQRKYAVAQQEEETGGSDEQQNKTLNARRRKLHNHLPAGSSLKGLILMTIYTSDRKTKNPLL
eukprot:GHVT01068495.1.p2 GENE.GHVT01068495.1~~GHVT01068495.1.p2  ORF type:complete len:118 (-),score=7.91 GHVT01068495.1:1160-1513(-)